MKNKEKPIYRSMVALSSFLNRKLEVFNPPVLIGTAAVVLGTIFLV